MLSTNDVKVTSGVIGAHPEGCMPHRSDQRKARVGFGWIGLTPSCLRRGTGVRLGLWLGAGMTVEVGVRG